MYYGKVFFFKQKTAYEIPLCDWSSDVCSSDLVRRSYFNRQRFFRQHEHLDGEQIDTLFVAAFQFEHSYIQQAAAKGTISVELANALNEHISTDQLVYIQSTN